MQIMRIVVVALAVCCASLALADEREQISGLYGEVGGVGEKEQGESWSVVEGELAGRKVWLRIHSNIDKAVRAKAPHRLTIRWPYPDNGEDGMPARELLDRFHVLEEALVSALEIDSVGVLSLIKTTAGSREWHVHFANANAAQDRINTAFSDLPDLRISLVAEFDPEWTEYTLFEDSAAGN